jgi:hypothetical protein
MRILCHQRLANSGNVLFITLILGGILGFTLSSYLLWVRSQNLLVAESQAWNSALSIAEAGVEEGMAQVNVNVGTAFPTNFFISIATNFAGGASGPWTKSNAMLGGSYSLIVSNDYPPTIYSTGFSSVPAINKSLSRTVKIKTAIYSLFTVGVTALQNVNLNGNTVMVDGFDSSNPLYSTNGQYSFPLRQAWGDVAVPSGVATIGNANIYGRLYLAPSASYSLQNNGMVGDLPANWPLQSGIEPGWLFNDFNREFPDVVPPDVTGAFTSLPYINSSNTYVLGSATYFLDNLSSSKPLFELKNNETLYVTGNATLYVTGSFQADNNSTIVIGPGGTLKLYVGTTSGAAVTTSFGQVNYDPSANCYNLRFFGLPSNTSFTLNGNNAFMGTVYAPESDFSLKGSGTTGEFQGACVVKSVTMTGNFNFHYDKNLSRTGTPSGFTVAYWQEL